MLEPDNVLLRCPTCKSELISASGTGENGLPQNKLVCNVCSAGYLDRGGYYDFLGNEGIVYRGRREEVIRTIYARVYTPVTNFMFLFCGGAMNARNEVMSRLSLKEGASVLETGMGYGENFLWLNRHEKGLRLYGADIQHEMVLSCMANLRKWNIDAELVRANAQDLPFPDGAFDVVFHLGAINLFDDRKKAISEMIRVARPGSHIVIADETEKAGRLFNIFTGATDKIVPPVDLVPGEMRNITLTTIWRGYGYVIEFDTQKV